MALTDIEKRWLEELVENTAVRTADNAIDRLLKMHVATCVHGRRLSRISWLSVGIGIGSSIGGGTIVVTLLKLLQATGGG